jgi:hypothetical protein
MAFLWQRTSLTDLLELPKRHLITKRRLFNGCLLYQLLLKGDFYVIEPGVALCSKIGPGKYLVGSLLNFLGLLLSRLLKNRWRIKRRLAASLLVPHRL